MWATYHACLQTVEHSYSTHYVYLFLDMSTRVGKRIFLTLLAMITFSQKPKNEKS